MKAVKFLLAISSLAVSSFAFAQNDSVNNSLHVKIGAYYNTRLNYFGRTDSLQSSGFFPMAELWAGEHWYINAAPVFVNNSIDHFQYAGTVATAGYLFNDHKKWAGNFYFVKPFYQKTSQLVQSVLKAQLAGTLTFQNKIINITGGADVKWSDGTDIGLTAGADHILRFSLNTKTALVLDPSVYVYAGTRRFTNTYTKKTNGFLLFPGTEQEVSESVKRFDVLSYEISMPIILAVGKWQLIAIPAYVLPQNIIAGTERGKNMVYATLGTKMNF